MEYNIFAPSIMSFVVSVDVKHHVYLTFLPLKFWEHLYNQKRVGFVDTQYTKDKSCVLSSHFFQVVLWWWCGQFSLSLFTNASKVWHLRQQHFCMQVTEYTRFAVATKIDKKKAARLV